MEIRINKIDAVRALYGRSSYHQADGNGNVKWKDGHETTAEETKAINAKTISLQEEYDANRYQRDRAAAYDSIGNQLDMLMKDMKNNTTTHQESCEAVKARFQKP